MLFALPRQTDQFISDTSDNSFIVACEFPESNLSILPDQVLPNRTSGCRVMSQAQVLCEKMVIIAWVLEIFLNCCSCLRFAKWRSAVTLIGTYSSHLFLVSKTVARPTLLLLSLILHKVWASPWNTWGDFWKNCCDSFTWTCSQTRKWCVLHERVLAWVRTCELRIASV